MTIVLNFILQSACGESNCRETPSGVNMSTDWMEFQALIDEKTHCGKENGVIWIDTTLYDALTNLDNETLSKDFRDFYEINNPGLDVYWNYHDLNYDYN